MKKPLYLWMVIAIIAMAMTGCEKKKLPVPEEIEIPASSKEVFSAGISFDSGIIEVGTGTNPEEDTWDGTIPDSDEEPGQEEEVPQVKEVRFTAPASWNVTITETKAVDWLVVEPMSGAAGDVKMTVTALANSTYMDRSAAVTINAGGSKATFEVAQVAKPIPVSSVTLDRSELSIAEGQSMTLKATVKPDDAADKTVVWDSSNKAVVTVDANGKVTAWRAGKATIRAKADRKSAYCKVSVTAEATGISLNRTTLELTEGETETLTVRLEPANTTDPVTWSSSDPSIATVDASGKVTAVKAGVAEITVKAGGQSATCTVTVKAKVIPVASITLNKTRVTLHPGETDTLVATVSPDNASEQTITWTSSYPAAVTVDENGKITAVAVGASTIHASCGGKSTSCEVTVNPNSVESVSLNKKELSLTEGESETLTATVKPDNATDKTVTWSSSDASVATVDATGKVTAVKAGTATITAKAGDKSATCTVTVKAKVIPVTSITLNKASLDLTEGETETLTATVGPDNATDKTVTWSTSDSSVATVDASGKVTAVKAGTATITAKSGDKSATCTVTVKARVIPVTSITLNKASLDLMEGESETLTATVKPDDATDKTVTWSTSDASIASVDTNGKVTAAKAGTATITAKAGELSVNCIVAVSVKADGSHEGVTENEWYL